MTRGGRQPGGRVQHVPPGPSVFMLPTPPTSRGRHQRPRRPSASHLHARERESEFSGARAGPAPRPGTARHGGSLTAKQLIGDRHEIPAEILVSTTRPPPPKPSGRLRP